jgi:hypothetical protein
MLDPVGVPDDVTGMRVLFYDWDWATAQQNV